MATLQLFVGQASEDGEDRDIWTLTTLTDFAKAWQLTPQEQGREIGFPKIVVF
jgi:hypothetical protein